MSKKIGAKHLATLVSIDADFPENFIREHSLFGATQFIIFQDNQMEKILKDGLGPLQSDSVEGFISDPALPAGQTNVTFTSGFDSVLKNGYPSAFQFCLVKVSKTTDFIGSKSFLHLEQTHGKSFSKGFLEIQVICLMQ